MPDRQSKEPVSSFDPAALRPLRQERRLTLDELAVLTGTARTRSVAYERGGRGIGIGMLTRLASVLGVEPVELISGEAAGLVVGDQDHLSLGHGAVGAIRLNPSHPSVGQLLATLAAA